MAPRQGGLEGCSVCHDPSLLQLMSITGTRGYTVSDEDQVIFPSSILLQQLLRNSNLILVDCQVERIRLAVGKFIIQLQTGSNHTQK